MGKLNTAKSDATTRYLRDVVGYELLTKAEEQELGRRIKEGDKEALNRLVTANLRYVIVVAKRYQGRGLDLIDLVQEGNLGLMRAAEKFDHTRGFRFLTYANWHIKQCIERAVKEYGSTIYLPLNFQADAKKVRDFVEWHREKNGGENPSVELIAKRLHLTPDRVSDALEVCPETISLDEPSGDGGAVLMGSVVDLTTEDPILGLIASFDQEKVRRTLAKLTSRQREVITHRFGLDGSEPVTLREVGEKLNLTRERIRQVEAEALSNFEYIWRKGVPKRKIEETDDNSDDENVA